MTRIAVTWLAGVGPARSWKRSRKWLVSRAPCSEFASSRVKAPDNLKIIGPDGEPFLTYTELVKQRNVERQRAEDQSRKRADRLAALPPELGIEPD